MELKDSSVFKKEYQLSKRRGKNLEKLEEIFNLFKKEEKLPAKYKKHQLKGEYQGATELHIENDWLLIYYQSKGSIILARLGTHADLFG